nr:MAG TPA: hypothetical protein [Caudoviricetes sp.]
MRIKPIYDRLHRKDARLQGTALVGNIRDGLLTNLHFIKVQIIRKLLANKLFDFFSIHSLDNFKIDVYNFIAASVKFCRYYNEGFSCACKVVALIARNVSVIYRLPPCFLIQS